MAPTLPFLIYTSLTGRSDRRRTAKLTDASQSGGISEKDRDERLALSLPARPPGELLWLHAATPYALRPIIELFARIAEDRPDLHGLITFPPDDRPDPLPQVKGCSFCCVPDDNLVIAQRFLAHWQPDCLIWVGGRFQPHLLWRARKDGLKSLSVDAPKSTITLAPSVPVPGLRAAVLQSFDHVITASHDATMPWRRAGVESECIEALGYLEEGGMAAPLDDQELTRLTGEIGTRPLWFATRVAPQEFTEITRAHKRALRRAHRLLMVITLADPDSLAAAVTRLETAGLMVAEDRQGLEISEAVQVLIATDQAKEPLWHRLAPVSYLGQSLSQHGGIDPYPAAAMGSAILHGPHVDTFKSAYGRLEIGHATQRVRDGFELGEELDRLLSPDQAARMAQAAWEVTTSGAEVTDRVAALAHDILDLSERGGM